MVIISGITQVNIVQLHSTYVLMLVAASTHTDRNMWSVSL